MPNKPNIIVILADDMGYSDLGCYGSEIRTPSLDALAAKGIRFTHAYNSARCCPARASLLTGLHPHQAGMGWMTAADLGPDGYAGNLNDRCLTIAEALAEGGYRSYMSGKWHLASVRSIGPEGPKHSWPRQRGFDRYYGTLAGGGSYFTPRITSDNDPIEREEGFYYTDAISDNACRFIEDHRTQHTEDPFFLYVAYTTPHWPLHAKPEDIARYRGKYRSGWDAMRIEKFNRMRAMDLLDENWSLSPRDPEVPAWESLSPEKQDEFDLRMAIYSAQIDCMDQGIGRIVRTLEAGGILDDTLMIFLSDNGGCHEEIHRKNDDPKDFGTDRSFESYGRPWANYSNTPFREFKSWVHEGGIATPMIAHWGKGITGGGRFYHGPVHITDFMPTCLELARTDYAPDPARNAWDLVGKSFTPAFTGEPIERDCIFWEHEANRALREGKWKLVAKGIDGPWELYDMEIDRTELNDLSGEHPDRAERMASKWEHIAETTDVLPLDGRTWGERCGG